MVINNSKHLKILTGLLAILAGLMLVGCQTPNPINTVDTIPPIITVAGFTNGQTTNVIAGDGFVIPEALAIDNIDGPVAVTTNDGRYDNNQIDIYNVAYTAEDNAGNSSTFMITIIVVSSDTTSPVIIVTGYTNGQTTNVIAGDGFVIPEALAIDNVDGPVAVTTNDGRYDNNQVSTYNVAYSASDSDGNFSTFTLTIIVDPDIIPPVITVFGYSNEQKINVIAGDGFVIPEATATDNVDGSVAVITNDDGYDNNVTNTYTVVYTAMDTAGNATNFMIAIVVSPDTIAPVITVTGFTEKGQTTNVLAGDGFVIPEATAIDNIDGQVAVTTNDDGYSNNVPGTYRVNYISSDMAGNSSDFDLTINVADSMSPVITVDGYTNGQTTNVENGEGFVIPAPMALDDVDGQLKVTTNDDGYDNNVTNTYTVVYTAMDFTGNSSSFTIVIVVEDIYDVNGFNRETGIHRNMTKVLAGDGLFNDYFGYSVAIDGDYAIVGAYLHDVKGDASGAAYIFNRSNGNWTEQAKLFPTAGMLGDQFGYSVAIDGDYAIVGAYLHNAKSGAAYVFTRSGNNWTEQAELSAIDGALDDQFGYSVAIDGDYVIVGAYLHDANSTNSGAAYIFNRTDTRWHQLIKLSNSDATSYDYFGVSVAIDGAYAIVGAHSNDNNGENSGAAYIFNRDDGWIEKAKLTANDAADLDNFGYSVAIDGDYAIVGAYLDDDNGQNSGAAYVFNRTDTNWSEQAKLTAIDGALNDRFGVSVAIDGDYAIVGAYLDGDNGENSGAAYVFNRTDTNWSEQAKLTAIDGALNDRFGVSVSIDSNYVLIGANLGGESADPNTGSAYIYELRQ